MSNFKVVWQPLEGSQELALSCPANIILYHGTRGPGKTDTQLMRFRKRVGLGYGRHWRGVIFDLEYKMLDDMVSKSFRWFPNFYDGCKFINSKSDYKWVWKTGEELLFRSIKKDEDYWGFHGQEFPFIGWNELTKYANGNLFEAMMSCNRTSFRSEDFPYYIDRKIYERTGTEHRVGRTHKNALVRYLPELTLEVFATTNPFGVGHNWVKEQFISAGKPGQIIKQSTVVFNPRTQKEEPIVRTQTHIFGSYKENKYLPPEYVASLVNITDEDKKKAWLHGDWDVVCGGIFEGCWDKNQHVLPFKDVVIPSTWRITRSFDYGSSKPFSVGWWAISDGSDLTWLDGKRMSTIKGDVFRIKEWYGCEKGKANTGLRLLSTKIAEGIIAREILANLYGKVHPGPADNSINDVIDGNSIASMMQKPVTIQSKKYPGIIWTPSDKSPGSRIAGWEKMREYFSNSKKQYLRDILGEIIEPKEAIPRSKPGLFVFDNCPSFIKLVPTLPRDVDNLDDVDTDSEDHIGDESRYFILSLGQGVKSGRTEGTQ